MTEIERLKENLKKLSLHTMSSIFEEEAKKAAKIKMSYSGYLARLIEEEILAKTDRSIQRRIANAKFPCIKTLESFNFSFQPSLNPQAIYELAQLSFLEKAETILFCGPPGVGKTHLAIALGIKVCMARKSVLFSTVTSLIEQLSAACITKEISSKLSALSRLDLLILDELGYNSLEKHEARLFFQLVNSRYEKGSIILTSNKPFEEWGEIFGDEIIAGAILDRLIHHSNIFVINGPSYRAKDKLKNK